MAFEKKGREGKPLMIALDGISGSGKTFTALRLAHLLGENVFVIDTERGASRLYYGEDVDGKPWEFMSAVLPTFSVDYYIDSIQEAIRLGADVIVVDGLSQAWNGSNGVLEVVDAIGSQKSADGRERGTFTGWKEGSKVQNRLIDAILSSPVHMICTMRAKCEYLVEKTDSGKTKIRKAGLKPIQRDELEYEFDLIFRMDGAVGTVTKSRCRQIVDGSVWDKPGPELVKTLQEWLKTGKERTERQPQQDVEDLLPEESELLESARQTVKNLLQSGRVQRSDVDAWRDLAGIEPGRKLSREETLQLASELSWYADNGRWERVPF